MMNNLTKYKKVYKKYTNCTNNGIRKILATTTFIFKITAAFEIRDGLKFKSQRICLRIRLRLPTAVYV